MPTTTSSELPSLNSHVSVGTPFDSVVTHNASLKHTPLVAGLNIKNQSPPIDRLKFYAATLIQSNYRGRLSRTLPKMLRETPNQNGQYLKPLPSFKQLSS